MVKDKHMIVVYRRIKDVNFNNALFLIAKRKVDKFGNLINYTVGSHIKDVNTGIIYHVMARDKAHNNIMVLKEASVKLTSEEKNLLKEKRIEDLTNDVRNLIKLNLNRQVYKGVQLRLINRKDYNSKNAMRFIINETNQNIWIPKCYLENDGTIKNGVNLDFIVNTWHFKNKLNISYGNKN